MADYSLKSPEHPGEDKGLMKGLVFICEPRRVHVMSDSVIAQEVARTYVRFRGCTSFLVCTYSHVPHAMCHETREGGHLK